ncbi:MAG: hypothetical protein RIQ33_598 [Bacteroidota bacterium]|jgi:DNA polymerase (family 10)
MNNFTNEEIADSLKYLSKLMDLHDENSFKSKSYNSASFQIDNWKTPLYEMEDKAILKIPSVGASILNLIHEYQQTGGIKALDDLLLKTPEGLLNMMKIKGLGPKKLRTIWLELEIEDIGELLYACKENRLITLKGFGEKTQIDIIQQIHFIHQNKNKFFYAEGLLVATTLLHQLQTTFTEDKFEITGQVRRKENVIDEIEIITSFENEMELINELETIQDISEIDFDEACMMIECRYKQRFPIKIFISDEQNFIFNWWQSTSTQKHIEQIGFIQKQNYLTETQLYQSIQLSYIEPELREGTIEIELAKQNLLPQLIEEKDIKGVIHCHSTYSDGKNTLQQLAECCIGKGFEYLCLSDHSQSATYASGLKYDAISKQHHEIDILNQQLFPFKIFKGIESDILYSGDLDYPEDVLKSFDFVIASVHSVLKMTEETAMKRLIKAIENPYTTILGHPTGRLLLSRKGYPINHTKIIDACAANKVVLELNASPYRLDVDWRWINYAIEKNVLISINPDAHDLEGIDDIKYGIASARKGFLSSSQCFNNKGLKEIEKYFSEKRK